MFVVMMRRWKLVAPLALAALAIAVVSAGVLSSAAASGVKFHFFGRAIALEDNSIVLPDWNCDTGNLDINGGSLDTGHCNAVFGGNATVGQNELGVTVVADFAEATVKSNNTKHEGHVIASSDVEGLVVSIGGFVLLETKPFSFLKKSVVVATAEAECQANKHGIPTADARGKLKISGLKVREGTNLDNLSFDGGVNESFPVINALTVFGSFAEQITLNEQQVFADGGIAFIKMNGIHLIITDFAGTVILDISVDHLFAGIHCAKHLPQDDAIGA